MIPLVTVLVVLDTSVLVAAWRSRRGASFALVSRLGTGRFDIVVSVPLVIEYESALRRCAGVGGLTQEDVGTFLDFLCSVARPQGIFFLWRPLLRDPNDDMVTEVAVAAGCDTLVTHNTRDFFGVDQFGIRVVTPGEFLKKIGGPT